MGREEAVWRDEDSGRGERFENEPNDQVKKAWYRAQNVWTTTPTNEVKNEEFTYTPDKLNRASVASNGVVTNYAAPNGLNQYPSVGHAAIGYDDHFNIANYNGATYIYDAQSRLVGGSMQATYDGLGRCVRRVTSAGTRLYTYDGWKPILEWNGNGSWQAWNMYGAGPDEILARNDATYGPTIYKLDKQGNVMALLDGSSNVLEKYFYDAFGYPTVTDHWGNETGHSSAYGNRFLFTGREYIAELGIYDYRHRMYHPALGRFLQMDPTGFDAGDMNLFRYCGDDPVDRSDPTGLFDVWRHLKDFYVGNPSMDVVRDAWNNRSNSGLTMAPLGRTDASPNLRQYSDWRDAADSRREETMNLVQGDHIEYGGELAQRDDNSRNYVATSPHPGLGVKKVDDGVERGYHGYSQAFSPDKTRVPRGYHMTGFYYGHVFHDPRKFHYDAIRAQKHGLDAVLFLPARAHAISQRPISLYYDHNTTPPE